MKDKNNIRIPTEVASPRIPTEVAAPRVPTAVAAPDGSFSEAAEENTDPVYSILMNADTSCFSSYEEFRKAAAEIKTLESVSSITYEVTKPLCSSGSESAVFLCTAPSGTRVAAKVYYTCVNASLSSVKARKAVLSYMQTEQGQKYTLPVNDFGLKEAGQARCYFEITPYCPSGDLSDDGKFSFTKLTRIIKSVNESIKSIHDAGILHRDIKPENLFYYKDRYVIGDFGIAQLSESGENRRPSGSFGYSAPESMQTISYSNPCYIYDERCDYYSFGITVASLYNGSFVFGDMTDEAIRESVQMSRIPLTRTDEHREEVENLIKGLCQYTPGLRFGYKEVNSWLENHNYTYNSSTDSSQWPKSFYINDIECTDERSLFEAITKNQSCWNEGKNLLFNSNKYFEKFFVSFNNYIARRAELIESDYRTGDKNKGLSVFLKKVYPGGPIVWRGQTFNSLSEIAKKAAKTKTPAAYGEILEKRVISDWLKNTPGIEQDEATIKEIESIEELAMTMPIHACCRFGFTFGKREITLKGHTANDFQSLADLIFSSPEIFYSNEVLSKLFNVDEGAELYGFLMSLECGNIISETIYNFTGNKKEMLTAIFYMFDEIASVCGANPEKIRTFFINYGPWGYITYIKKLISQGNIYSPLDAAGKNIISKIKKIKVSASLTLPLINNAFENAAEITDSFTALVEDNPFLLREGIYNSNAILCLHTKGCLMGDFFGKKAPAGFFQELGKGVIEY